MRRVLAAIGVLSALVAIALALWWTLRTGSPESVAIAFIEAQYRGDDDAAYALIDPEQVAGGYTRERFGARPVRPEPYLANNGRIEVRAENWLFPMPQTASQRMGLTSNATLELDGRALVQLVLRVPDREAIAGAVSRVERPEGETFEETEERLFHAEPPLRDVADSTVVVRRNGRWFVSIDEEFEADQRADLEAQRAIKAAIRSGSWSGAARLCVDAPALARPWVASDCSFAASKSSAAAP